MLDYTCFKKHFVIKIIKGLKMHIFEKTEEIEELKKFMNNNNIKKIDFLGNMEEFYGNDHSQLKITNSLGKLYKNVGIKNEIYTLLDKLFEKIETSKEIGFKVGSMSFVLDAENNLDINIDCTILVPRHFVDNVQV